MKLLWQQIASTTITEILCSTKLDGVVLDLEHGCFNNSDIYQSIQIASLKRKKVLVRITDIDKSLVRMVLDANADGIILSTVESVSNFMNLYKICDYNLQRGQGLVRENFWGEKPFSKRLPLIIPQIETKAGVVISDSLSNVYSGPVLVGPYDLSASCGEVGNFNNEEFKSGMRMLKKTFGTKLGYHIVKDVDKQIEGLKDSEFLAFGMDSLFLIDGIKRIEEAVL